MAALVWVGGMQLVKRVCWCAAGGMLYFEESGLRKPRNAGGFIPQTHGSVRSMVRFGPPPLACPPFDVTFFLIT